MFTSLIDNRQCSGRSMPYRVGENVTQQFCVQTRNLFTVSINTSRQGHHHI